MSSSAYGGISMFWRLSLSMLMAIIFVDNVAAQVQINEVDRDFQNGTIVTIEGLNFGTMEFFSPKMWDDLTDPAYDGYGDGDIFPTREGTYGHPKDPNAPQNRADYPETTTPSVLETNTVRVPGRPVIRFLNTRGSALLELGDVGGDFLIADWWIYSTDIMAGHYREIKLGRFWAGSSGVAGRISLYPNHIQYDTTEGTDDKYGRWVTDGAWNHYRITIDSSGGLSTGKGIVRFYWNNELVSSINDLSFDEAVDKGPNFTWAEMIGAVDYNQTDPRIGPTFVGDVYLNNTRAMVALGNAPKWSEVRHYELQIPRDWQPKSIQVDANTGSFEQGESVWLYVIDHNGNVNETGLSVETNFTPPPPLEGPGEPGQPVVKGS